MKDIAKFIAGFRRFQEKYFSEDRELFELKTSKETMGGVTACHTNLFM